MTNYWLSTNREKTAENIYYETIGYLKQSIRNQNNISVEKILDFMQSEFKTELERLNKAFPDKK
jgi:hypothetical protein